MMIGAVVILLLRQIKRIREWIKGTGWQPGWVSGVLAGFLSGIFGGAVSIPGPPMVHYRLYLRTGITADYRIPEREEKWTEKPRAD